MDTHAGAEMREYKDYLAPRRHDEPFRADPPLEVVIGADR
jgi:hypothetical protein